MDNPTSRAFRLALRMVAFVPFALAALTVWSLPVDARVTRFEVINVESPAFEGHTFGPVGTYDKIVARATIAIDPSDRHNAEIVDLQLAPRNAAGMVEAVSEVEILRPTDPAKANRVLLYEPVNRGRKLSLVLLNDAPGGNALVNAASAGNGFLMGQGFTIVWSGWQADVLAGDGRLTFSAPIAPNVVGTVLDEFVFDNLTNPVSAALSYPAADMDPHRRLLITRTLGVRE